MRVQTFGQQIRTLRNSMGLTLTQLAAKLEMDSANLSKIETGKREFDDKRLQSLCTVFSLNIEEMRIELWSDRFANRVYQDSIDSRIFSLAEKKVKYMNNTNHQ
ncbi:helix-turn-helix transcriptional regulator [bacterium AH-315-C07]|nr:helix-turn-helix transcriptional regulator [bacterium AH-315-C07]